MQPAQAAAPGSTKIHLCHSPVLLHQTRIIWYPNHPNNISTSSRITMKIEMRGLTAESCAHAAADAFRREVYIYTHTHAYAFAFVPTSTATTLLRYRVMLLLLRARRAEKPARNARITARFTHALYIFAFLHCASVYNAFRATRGSGLRALLPPPPHS